MRREAKQREREREARTAEADLRSSTCCIWGHVDTSYWTAFAKQTSNKTKQEGLHRGITQQIGATYFPIETIKQRTKAFKNQCIPGCRSPRHRHSGTQVVHKSQIPRPQPLRHRHPRYRHHARLATPNPGVSQSSQNATNPFRNRLEQGGQGEHWLETVS